MTEMPPNLPEDPADAALHHAFAALAAERGQMTDALLDEEIRILPPDEAWPAQFGRERARLEASLRGSLAVAIEHVGSTAVAELDAVPQVDLLLGIPPNDRQPGRAAEIVTVLQTLGYESLGEAGLPGRWALRYRGDGPHFNIALVAEGGVHWRRQVAARDHLRANPALARHYAAAKWAAATQGAPNLLGYKRRMGPVLRDVLAGAVPPEPAPSFEPVHLVAPSRDRLRAFEAAVAGGWSPNTTRDVTAETLDALRTDPDRYLAELNGTQEGTIVLPDGTTVPRLPGRVFWIWDSTFSGVINIRHVPGTEDLPPHVSGHIGYSVVPAKRNRGYATEALRLALLEARKLGLARVAITCDPDNHASRRVIERNGGVLRGHGEHHGEPKVEFWVTTPPG